MDICKRRTGCSGYMRRHVHDIVKQQLVALRLAQERGQHIGHKKAESGSYRPLEWPGTRMAEIPHLHYLAAGAHIGHTLEHRERLRKSTHTHGSLPSPRREGHHHLATLTRIGGENIVPVAVAHRAQSYAIEIFIHDSNVKLPLKGLIRNYSAQQRQAFLFTIHAISPQISQ